MGAACEWRPLPGQNITSYRVVIGALREGQLHRDSVLIKIVKEPRVALDALRPAAAYRVEVEALNPVGPSPSATAVFHTPELPRMNPPSLPSPLSPPDSVKRLQRRAWPLPAVA